MKPVGLRDPRTGKTPWAVVQLRKENLRADSYNLVGFQNHLKFGEQARVLRLIPGLENARFLRYGQIHRNTYIQAPLLLDECLRLDVHPACAEWAARKESQASLLGPRNQLSSFPNHPLRRPALRRRGLHRIHRHRPARRPLRRRIVRGEEPRPPRAPAPSARWSTTSPTPIPKTSSPPTSPSTCWKPLEEELRKKVRDKKERHRIVCERALAAFDAWWARHSLHSRIRAPVS
jgi:methylenetetrahydrofolate--tRNA-(uracil-5-)-methyltransferase